jgi:hypothetical protein
MRGVRVCAHSQSSDQKTKKKALVVSKNNLSVYTKSSTYCIRGFLLGGDNARACAGGQGREWMKGTATKALL